MTDSEKGRTERQQQLEQMAKADPSAVEALFREYFPEVKSLPVGSLMIQNIVAHEMDMEPARFRG